MENLVINVYKIEKLNTGLTWMIGILTTYHDFERFQAWAEATFYFLF
jgi:hypothetical protein